MERTMMRMGARMLSLAVIVFAPLASAVEPRVYQLGDGGAVSPHLRLEFGSDNNPLRAAEGSEQAIYLRLNPSLRYLVRQRNNRLTFSYTGDYYQYLEEFCSRSDTVRPGDCPTDGEPSRDKASYQDHNFSVDGFLEISNRLRTTLELSQDLEHQPLGTGQSGTRGVLNSIPSPDAWSRSTARAVVSYGAARARGQVQGSLTFRDQSFNSDRPDDFTNLAERFVAPGVRLLYRIGTRTQLFAGLSRGEVTGGNSERTVNSQSFGVVLDASAITSGSFTLRNTQENFDRDGRTDLDFLGWEVELTWRPRRFSTVTVVGGRESQRSSTNNDIGLITELDVEWEHFWRERFSTQVTAGLALSEDVDRFSVGQGTEVNTVSLRFEGNYNIRRWLDIGGFVAIDTSSGSEIVNGSDQSRDFERTQIGFTTNGTF